MTAPVPPGLHSLYCACQNIYPNQPNPLQVTAVVKYWLGGPDPLDYISMYANPGDPQHNIPPHWHYVSFGLSDLHGDGRVHVVSGIDTPSGFGFELTFRLKKDPGETNPPTWPATVMQALAKYVFQSENILCAGDHVSWHCSLDNSESRIQHMLMMEDPQLGSTMTPFGSVTFIQIIGVCVQELKAAQQWNVSGVIELMKSVEGAGGIYQVTDMRRGETIFELDPDIQEAVDDGIAIEGSNLSGVSAKCSWSDNLPNSSDRDEENNITRNRNSSESDTGLKEEKQSELVKREKLSPLTRNTSSSSKNSRSSSMSVSHDNQNQLNSRMSYASETGEPESTSELIEIKFLNSIHLTLNLEAGTVLPLALRGRLKHGRHFTFKSVSGELAVTLISSSVSGAYVNAEQPYAIHGSWLQILISDELVDIMLTDLKEVNDSIEVPRTYIWESQKFAITLQPEAI